MTCHEYIMRVVTRAPGAGYREVEELSPAVARELKMLDFVSFARREGARMHVFGLRSGAGLGRDQIRTLTDQFHNVAWRARKDDPQISGLHVAAILVYEKAPSPDALEFLLGRSRPRWPFGADRTTPMAVDLSSGEIHAPWFPAKAVSARWLAAVLK